MKYIKEILKALFWIGYTSSWWAASVWGYDSTKGLWAIPCVLSLIVLIFIIDFLIWNWKENN